MPGHSHGFTGRAHGGENSSMEKHTFPDGILLIDKPARLSSAAVVAAVKRITGAAKVGHGGTLDPFATGLMVCCLNRATRLARFFLAGSKHYTATLRLGSATDTQDVTGQAIAEMPWDGISETAIRRCTAGFTGWIEQLPPVYSALKHRGVPLYKLARKGFAVQKPARRVLISSIEITGIRLPDVQLEVICSAGTYIRTLGADLAKALGTCGHLRALRRLASGGFDLSRALAFEALEPLAQAGELRRHVISMADALTGFACHVADGQLVEKIRHGRPLTAADIPARAHPHETGKAAAYIKVIDGSGNLAAVLEKAAASETYRYCCVFSN